MAFLRLRVFVGAALSVYILASGAAFMVLMQCALRPLMAHLAQREGLERGASALASPGAVMANALLAGAR